MISELARTFINQFQSGFPITQHPFSSVAAELGVTEVTLIETIKALLETGLLSRFGALYDSQQMGGDVCLVAMQIPAADFERVAEQVNQFNEVAHNYEREHFFNLWFVLSTEKKAQQQSVLKQIAQVTQYPVYPFPKLQEYYIGLKFFINPQGQANTLSFKNQKIIQSNTPLTSLQRQIIKASQQGFTICSRPYQQIAEQIQQTEQAVINEMQKMQKQGIIRRIGAIPNHYKLGIKANVMSVWDVPSAQINEIGEKIGKLDFVSHSYHRPRHLPQWPYNLFAMVHGQKRDEVLTKVELIKDMLSPYYRQHDVLFSKKILKKVGLRL